MVVKSSTDDIPEKRNRLEPVSIVNTAVRKLVYAAAAMTGVTAGAGSDASTAGAVGAGGASVAGFSNGGRGVGSSITGGVLVNLGRCIDFLLLDLEEISYAC